MLLLFSLVQAAYLLTYLLTPWSRELLEKLTDLQLVKKFPAFCGTYPIHKCRHPFLSWASLIQSIPPNLTSWRSILILFHHLCLGLRSGLFPPGFPTKTLYTLLPYPIHATCPAHLIPLDFITCTILGREYITLSSSILFFYFVQLIHTAWGHHPKQDIEHVKKLHNIN